MPKAVFRENGVKVLREMTPEEEAQWRSTQPEVKPEPLEQRLESIFNQVIEDPKVATPTDLIADMEIVATVVERSLRRGRVEVAKRAIERLDLPAELQPVQQALLDEFPEEG